MNWELNSKFLKAENQALRDQIDWLQAELKRVHKANRENADNHREDLERIEQLKLGLEDANNKALHWKKAALMWAYGFEPEWWEAKSKWL